MTVDEIKRELDALGAATAQETPAPDPESDPAGPGPEIGPRHCTVATDAGALNIRCKPGGAVLKAVPDGTELTAIGDPEDGWQRVAIEAWVMAKFLA